MSSMRVMATCGLMGEAVGKAAAVACKNSIVPHEVYLKKLSELKTGDKVSVTYFSGGVYVSCTGKVSKINTVNREVTIVKKPIPIDDIYDITTEE